ncbi:hypothetical protein ACVWZM_009065 [Bradyrhizobium sp. USDA 4501]
MHVAREERIGGQAETSCNFGWSSGCRSVSFTFTGWWYEGIHRGPLRNDLMLGGAYILHRRHDARMIVQVGPGRTLVELAKDAIVAQ